jgi:hypothetical protein
MQFDGSALALQRTVHPCCINGRSPHLAQELLKRGYRKLAALVPNLHAHIEAETELLSLHRIALLTKDNVFSGEIDRIA